MQFTQYSTNFICYAYMWIKYITTVWGPLLTRQPLQRLERMQNQAVAKTV